MNTFRTFGLPVAGLLLALSAAAQTPTTHLPTHRVHRMPAAKPAPHMVPNTSPAARAADPLRNSRNNGAGQSGYAAPGEPIIPPVDNGKNTPSYDGPATGHGAGSTKTTLATPK